MKFTMPDLTALALAHPFHAIVLLAILYFTTKRILRIITKKKIKHFPRKYPQDAQKGVKKDHYDFAVVGAGPAGSTCAYYAATNGRKTVLFEKKKFPRDKYCGDAVCQTGIEILMEMGVYKTLLEERKAHIADSGGMVSPNGVSYIGRSKEMLGGEVPAALACKRLHLDNAIAMAAKRAGADLKEDSPVENATFDERQGLWTIHVEGSDKKYTARVLVCSDGATSLLARKLGIVKTPPNSTASRAYTEGGTHNFKADGVVFWNQELLPGYSAIFRHPDDVINFCIYIIPGNPKVDPDDLAFWHERLAKTDPNISRALGKSYKAERMKAGSLRLGGEPVSYDRHCICVGDSAGMTDPMTGEGIHIAMGAGKLAAGFLEEVICQGNYDKQVMALWHERWMEDFGYDFRWSMRIAQLIYRFPILLDASTNAVRRKGDKFLAKWADIMTGRRPKIHLLLPEFTIVITYELIILLIKRMFGKGPKLDLLKED